MDFSSKINLNSQEFRKFVPEDGPTRCDLFEYSENTLIRIRDPRQTGWTYADFELAQKELLMLESLGIKVIDRNCVFFETASVDGYGWLVPKLSGISLEMVTSTAVNISEIAKMLWGLNEYFRYKMQRPEEKYMSDIATFDQYMLLDETKVPILSDIDPILGFPSQFMSAQIHLLIEDVEKLGIAKEEGINEILSQLSETAEEIWEQFS